MSSDGVGDLGGVDAVFDGKRWVVYDIRKDSEADIAGLSPGLVIAALSVDPAARGRYQAKMRVADPAGAARSVSYEFAPRVRTSSRSMEARPSGVVVLRFDIFDAETIDWALGQLRQAEPAPLLLDLRSNRGGDIDEMVRFVSAFLPSGVLVGNSKGRRWPHTFPLNATNDAMEYRGAVAVLMSPKTGSAGEVTSYTLGKHRKAPLVGERTAGAVLAARTFTLSDGGELMIATGNFTTADNQRLEGVGVLPTITATPTLEAIREGRDLVIETGERAVLSVAPGVEP
jgi:C-terminal processing protease CtpA/Prc